VEVVVAFVWLFYVRESLHRRERECLEGKADPKKYHFAPDIMRRGKRCPNNFL